MATLTLTAAATAAAQMLGVLDSGEALSTQQLTDALGLSNDMFDNWSSDPKMIVQLTRIAWNLVQGTQSYTIGTGQVINITRPVAFVSAARINSSGSGGPVAVLDGVKWAALPDRQRQSAMVESLLYDRGNPTGTVYVSPVPLVATLSIEAWVWAALSQFADLTTPLAMLPGYARLVKSALAIEMAPWFDMEPTPQTMKNYSAAVANIEELNAALFATLTDAQ